MSLTEQSASPDAIRAAYWTVRAEILDCIAHGEIPESARDMNDIHDHVDGNALGPLLDDDPETGTPRFTYADSVIVQAYADAWLTAGRPNGIPPMSEYLRGHLSEQGRTADATLVQGDA